MCEVVDQRKNNRVCRGDHQLGAAGREAEQDAGRENEEKDGHKKCAEPVHFILRTNVFWPNVTRISERSRLDTMTDTGNWITESSESDTRTSYPVTARVWEGATAACESVVIADSAVFGRMLFLDGELQSASADEHIYHEALVHPVMTMAPVDARVLVVGGGEGATVREVLKWKPRFVDWVDIDGDLVDLCRKHLGWAPDVYADPVVKFHGADIRETLPELGIYDVIILDLPDPDGDTGYLYSDAFMAVLHAHLDLYGSMVTHCGPVRPFGNIGEGFQRLRRQFGSQRFYTQMIPSFQSEWGFLLWSGQGLFRPEYTFPDGLRVADPHQMVIWENPSKLWRSALAASAK